MKKKTRAPTRPDDAKSKSFYNVWDALEDKGKLKDVEAVSDAMIGQACKAP